MSEDTDFRVERQRLLAEIAEEAAATAAWTGRSRFADAVMAALDAVPRHRFVSQFEEWLAYLNRPLGIGHGQTISQPYIVALMTDLLDLEPTDRVLEIGTGCGYQAAVISRLCARVYSIEVVPELAEAASQRLARLGFENIEVRFGDGFEGWPEQAPFDAIIVTAAPREVPNALIDQLKPGGRLVIPVGEPGGSQTLCRAVKDDSGKLTMSPLLPVAFVPMIRPDSRNPRWSP